VACRSAGIPDAALAGWRQVAVGNAEIGITVVVKPGSTAFATSAFFAILMLVLAPMILVFVLAVLVLELSFAIFVFVLVLATVFEATPLTPFLAP
jgi:hypothetical protein